MFILKKLFQFRDQANDDEKPFLAHLEDLRVTLTKMIITLVIAIIACWSLQGKLLEILRAPAEDISRAQQEEILPDHKKVDLVLPLSVETWEQAKIVERAAAALSPSEQEIYYASLGSPEIAFHARTAALLRSALTLPPDKREAFLQAIPEGVGDYSAADLAKQVRQLLESNSDPEVTDKVAEMSTLKPTESFVLSMKLACFAGLVVSLPLLLYFLLQFILPGLHATERQALWPALAIGFLLFITGVLFSYFLVLPKALLFFAQWSEKMGISNDWRIGEYISFASQFTLLFGASFELPVVVMFLVKLGLLGYDTMVRTRRYAIVAILVIAAILTPTPDIMTQLLMAGPMIILYEICIWLAWWDEKKAAKAEEKERHQRMERLLRDVGEPSDRATAGEAAAQEGDDFSTEEQIPSLDSLEEPDPDVGDLEEIGDSDEDEPLPPPATQEEPRRE